MDGTIIPCYKKHGKDPLLTDSYRGITVSPVLSKVLESIILRRLQDIMPLLNIPDILQTAYQKGLSCIDATFATQEALLIHLREGGHPYLCLFDLEKAFDSVELPVLLNSLFQVGINGKCWRLIKDWYLIKCSIQGLCKRVSLSSPFYKQGGETGLHPLTTIVYHCH